MKRSVKCPEIMIDMEKKTEINLFVLSISVKVCDLCWGG
jgi:hypothetical protein